MKSKQGNTSSSVLNIRKISLGKKLAGTVAFALLLTASLSIPGITVQFQAPNASITLGLPFAQLEFENPLTGTETVQGYKVLEWRDADYNKAGHPLFDDWNVSNGGGTLNEIYLGELGDSAWTATTVSSSIVSIHLNADDNDGKAEVLVDGVTVAKLDMYTATCCQTALILVSGLPNSPHTVTINDLGRSPIGLGDDVHILGAAALGEIKFKWNQPPVSVVPTNVFNGWNQPSMANQPPIPADDWVCTNSRPITKIRWWGSFLNWRESQPPQLPDAFYFRFWNDIPKGQDPTFPDLSHPGGMAWHPVYCTNYTWKFWGWDYDPFSKQFEACFLFEQGLDPMDWFYQPVSPTGSNTFWVSIEAAYTAGSGYPWGWKTRPRDPNSLAADAAVVFDPNVPFYGPLPMPPDQTNAWDMAFELISDPSASGTKWMQYPDLSTTGIDVDATLDPISGQSNLLADDFLCTATGPVTNISIWGSWKNNNFPLQGPGAVQFRLSIHSDIPATPTSPSMPGNVIWWTNYSPGPFGGTFVPIQDYEGWWTPPGDSSFLADGDNNCLRYDIPLPPTAFTQQGSPSSPVVYWLDVQAMPLGQGISGPAKFGWKTCITNWNDDATWTSMIEPLPTGFHGWIDLHYPWPHPRHPSSLDLAFSIEGPAQQTTPSTKWSQPPVPYTGTNTYCGWNELSIYGYTNIVADDWVCTNATPVTDVHWWGSFLGWSGFTPPQMPDAFVLSVWTDVPKGPNDAFSHPGACLTNIALTTGVTWKFDGWDLDPRHPELVPEACFKFEGELPSNSWFVQGPGTNTYWLSIAAAYGVQVPPYPFGWKTRPRDPNSLAPDDAVRIFSPTAPGPGSQYGFGTNIWWNGSSWDTAFALTTREQENCIRVVCSSNITITCASTSGAIVNFNSYATNFCTGGILPVTCTPPSGSLFPVGTTQVCCTNISPPWTNYCCFLVTVLTDTNPPNMSCPSGIIATTAPGQCVSNVSFVVIAPDNCDPAPVIVCVPPSGSPFPKGNTTVNCTATDASGNSNKCSFVVTILDQEPPTVNCPAPIVGDTDPGQCSKSNVTWIATAADNCPGVSPVTCSPPSGSTFSKGVTLVRCSAVDASGNSNTCSFTVTIIDREAPVAKCPSNIVSVVDAGQSTKSNVTWSASATDNCPGATIVCNPPSGSTFPVGVTPVTCMATDTSGNTNTCNFTVTIYWPKPSTNIVITNIVFTTKFNGWNEPSTEGLTTIAADDWVCTTTNPVTDIRWWGSFLGWTETTPPQLPDGFRFMFWSDAAANPGVPGSFSHPSNLVSSVYCTDYAWKFVGWDIDPRTLAYEACFQFDQRLATTQWFYQTNGPTGTNIYWLSIAAVYAQGTTPYIWGWKTRPRAADSPAPDDAVRLTPPQGPYQPLYWPDPTNSWDLAFELVSSYANMVVKYVQQPDFYGIDVNDTYQGGAGFLLADDFPCTMTGPLTDFTVWGSWRYDLVPSQLATFTLSIHSNVPAFPPSGYSMPGGLLWSQTFAPGQYGEIPLFSGQIEEGWLDPPGGYIYPGDHNCILYTFHVATNAFTQTNGTIYWLDVQAQLPSGAQAQFGWKTTSYMNHWMDSAVWALGFEQGHGPWNLLHDPRGAPSIDLAFAVVTSNNVYQLKWSQPPITSRYLTVQWKPQNFIHYQLQATTYLSNAPAHCVWSNVGPEVIGPVYQQSDTNILAPQRFYRVMSPWVDP